MLDELPDGISGSKETATPTGDPLFHVNHDNLVKLCDNRKGMLCTNTAKLLFLTKRAHPDTKLPVVFL